jgi:Flp pilus assembly protein TadB
MARSFHDTDEFQPWWVAAKTAKSAWVYCALYGILAVAVLGAYLFGAPWWFLIALVFFVIMALLFLVSALYLRRQ